MNSISNGIGRIASITALLSFFVYTGCFVAILLVNKAFVWTNIHDLAAYEAQSHIWLKYAGMASMLIYACAFVVIAICFAQGVSAEKAVIGKIAVCFALAFCIAVSISYFVQMTSTRLQLQSNASESLTQFTQSYSISAINGINMLGWTLFYALSTLALAFLPDVTALGISMKWAFLCNTAVMFAGLVGYMLNHFWTLALSMNLGLGGIGIWMILCLMQYFKLRA